MRRQEINCSRSPAPARELPGASTGEQKHPPTSPDRGPRFNVVHACAKISQISRMRVVSCHSHSGLACISLPWRRLADFTSGPYVKSLLGARSFLVLSRHYFWRRSKVPRGVLTGPWPREGRPDGKHGPLKWRAVVLMILVDLLGGQLDPTECRLGNGPFRS